MMQGIHKGATLDRASSESRCLKLTTKGAQGTKVYRDNHFIKELNALVQGMHRNI